MKNKTKGGRQRPARGRGENRPGSSQRFLERRTVEKQPASTPLIRVSKQIHTLVGFAIKSGQLVAGFEAVHRAASRHKIELVLVNAHISPRSERKIVNFLKVQQIPYFKTEAQDDWEKLWKLDKWKIMGITRGNLGKSILQNINDGA